MIFLSALVLAQALTFTPGYLTNDPIDPSRLGLATVNGRYAVRVWDGCTLTFSAGQNVIVAGADQLPNTAEGDVLIGTSDGYCSLTEATLMDNTPCFTNADGECDVDIENNGGSDG